MNELHDAIRDWLSDNLSRMLGVRVLPESVSFRTKKGQCTVNILRYGISREIQGFTPFTAFDGIDAVQDVSVESGHVNVKLSHELFSYLLAHVNSVYPTAIAPGESESSEGLALYKMLMLSRQTSSRQRQWLLCSRLSALKERHLLFFPKRLEPSARRDAERRYLSL